MAPTAFSPHTLLSSPTRRARHALTAVGLCGLLAVGACATTAKTSTDADDATSVPTSASVTVPAGNLPRTPTGSTLNFGQSAVLPASAFAAHGPLAMFTVTGITRGSGLPESTTKGGTPYFVYVTVTSLADTLSPAPRALGFAGSVNGTTASLTIPPPGNQKNCIAGTPPQTMRRGDSYSTCLVSIADPDESLREVIYWADTTGDITLDYQKSPLVWRTPGTPLGSQTATPRTSTAPRATPSAG